MSILPRELLNQPSYEVAPSLLGCRLIHDTAEGRVSVELSEVEAYEGLRDPASHAFGGQTPRNRPMFGPAGVLYVYFSYGMHWCANIVTGPDGDASAVLLRGGRVIVGIDLAHRRRGTVAERGLARGPACLTQALGIAGEHNGVDLLAGGELRLETTTAKPAEVAAGPRVGVSCAAEFPWRFWVTGDETVSAYRRSPRVRGVTVREP